MQAARSFIPLLIVSLLRALEWTLRIRMDDRCGFKQRDHPIIFVFWHNRLLLLPVLYRRFACGHRGYCLTSPSKDGAIVEGVMKHLGIGSVRGSSSRRGATALRELAAIVEQGHDVAITPDGPRGPKYHLHPGALKLAQLTGVPIIPVHVSYSRYWELKSWDGFRIPKPFSRIDVVLDVYRRIPGELTDEEFEGERARLEAEMTAAAATN